MYRFLKYMLIVMTLIILAFQVLLYRIEFTRNGFYSDTHYVTLFIKEIGLGPNSHYEEFLFPRYKLFFQCIKYHDYIQLLESGIEYIAISKNNFKVYIPPNKVYVNHDGNKYEIKENEIIQLNNFSGFDNVMIYFGGKNIEEQFKKDTVGYAVIDDLW